MRKQHPVLRAVVSLAFVITTFFCHLAALGLYGLGALAIESWMNIETWRDSRRQAIANIIIFLLPFAIVPVLMAFGPTADHVGTVKWVEGCRTNNIVRCYLSHKARGVWLIFKTYSNVSDGIATVLMAAAAVWAWWRGWLRIPPIAWWLMGLAVPVYLAMPTTLFGGSQVDLRLPPAMAFLFIAFVDWRLPTRKAQHAFLTTLFALVMLRVGLVVETWHRYTRYEDELASSIQEIEAGSKILVARSADLHSIRPVFYEPCLAIIERSSLVSLAFSDPAQQILTVSNKYRDIAGCCNDDPISVTELIKSPPTTSRDSPSGRIYWKDWNKVYDYVYVLGPGDQANPIPDKLELLRAGALFQLYRVRREPLA